jgi:hypothetical protein
MSLTALREGVDGLDRGCWEVNVELKDAGVVAWKTNEASIGITAAWKHFTKARFRGWGYPSNFVNLY